MPSLEAYAAAADSPSSVTIDEGPVRRDATIHQRRPQVPTFIGDDGEEYVVGFRPSSRTAIEEARRPLLIAYYNSAVEQTLGLRSRQTDWEPVVEPLDLVQTVTMTTPAYEKALRTARIAAEGRWPPPELSFDLLRPRGSLDEVITDVLVGHDQTVTGATCATSAEGSLASLIEAREAGLAYAGWCHSHGAHNVFHSPTDDQNIASLLRNSPVKRRVELDGLGFTLYYVPSIVINLAGDSPYVSIAFEYKRLGEREHRQVHNRHCGFRLVDGPPLAVDDDRLRRCINERVTFLGARGAAKPGEVERSGGRADQAGNLSAPVSLEYALSLVHPGEASPFLRWEYGPA